MTGAIAAFVMSPIMLLMTFREGSFEDGFQSLIAFGMATAILSYGTLAYWFASEDLTECIAAEEENGPDGDNAR